MIELTQEQWQAIAWEENPTVIEPESKTAYVVVPKAEYDQLRCGEADAALALRIAWMRRMRLCEEEIEESLRDDPPASVHEEMKANSRSRQPGQDYAARRSAAKVRDQVLTELGRAFTCPRSDRISENRNSRSTGPKRKRRPSVRRDFSRRGDRARRRDSGRRHYR